MEELPEKFPEYSIMYNTLSKQIEKLKLQIENVSKGETKEIKLKIKRYESEMIRIKKIFPRDYFEERY
ncbi:MAG: hypothetical protein GKS07_08245 [Nitrosopumilus sp.]|nr:MAG: hypothetical protein GKS07_08245 [Nitrosopumilus sp.]